MVAYADLVRFTSTSEGTGPMVVNGTIEGFQTPPQALFDGKEGWYTIVHQTASPTQKETGRGTWNHATQTLTRSSTRAQGSFSTASGNALVAFSAGVKTVTLGLNAHAMADLDSVLVGLAYVPTNYVPV